jgi:hypothetical protein
MHPLLPVFSNRNVSTDPGQFFRLLIRKLPSVDFFVDPAPVFAEALEDKIAGVGLMGGSEWGYLEQGVAGRVHTH